MAILYGFLFLGWLVAVILPEPYDQTAYTLLWGLFSVLPVVATILTRVITKDKSPWYLKPNFRKSWKTYLLAAFLPGVAIFLGGLLYFILFPQDLDLSARNLVAQYGQYGAPESLLLTPQTVFWIGLAFIFHLAVGFAGAYFCPRRRDRLARLFAAQPAEAHESAKSRPAARHFMGTGARPADLLRLQLWIELLGRAVERDVDDDPGLRGSGNVAGLCHHKIREHPSGGDFAWRGQCNRRITGAGLVLERQSVAGAKPHRPDWHGRLDHRGYLPNCQTWKG